MIGAAPAAKVRCIDCGGANLRTAYVRTPKDCNYVYRTDEEMQPDDSRYVILRCGDCASIFLHPHYFAESYAVYDDPRYFTGFFPDNIHTGGGPVLGTPISPNLARSEHRKWARLLLDTAGIVDAGGLRVMDIGCAKGDLVRGFNDCGCDACGIDVSRASTAEARESGLTVYTGRFEEADLPDGHFDVIVSTETFEHMADIAPITRAIAAKLKPGGSLVIQVPNDIEGYRMSFYGNIWWMIPPMHIRYFTRASMANIFARHGLRLTSIRTLGSFGGDVGSLVGWLLRKNGLRSVERSKAFKLAVFLAEVLLAPADRFLDSASRHSQMAVAFRKDPRH